MLYNNLKNIYILNDIWSSGDNIQFIGSTLRMAKWNDPIGFSHAPTWRVQVYQTKICIGSDSSLGKITHLICPRPKYSIF